jgi:hypothetical protein
LHPTISFAPSIIPAIGGAEQHVLMSDILFLSVKEFAGKLVKNEGAATGTGTLATLTASSGKDMYLARAQVVFAMDTLVSSTSLLNKIELQVNGTVVETALHSHLQSSGGGATVAFAYDFRNIGHSVAATQVIKLEVITLDADVTVEGFVECYEEPTGVSPFVASEFE